MFSTKISLTRFAWSVLLFAFVLLDMVWTIVAIEMGIAVEANPILISYTYEKLVLKQLVCLFLIWVVVTLTKYVPRTKLTKEPWLMTNAFTIAFVGYVVVYIVPSIIVNASR